MRTKVFGTIAVVFFTLVLTWRTEGQIIMGVIQSDITPVTFTDDHANSVDLHMPYGFSNSSGQFDLFGQAPLRQNFYNYDHRVSIYERAIRMACTGPERANETVLVQTRALLQQMGVTLDTIDTVITEMQPMVYAGTAISTSLSASKITSVLSKMQSAGSGFGDIVGNASLALQSVNNLSGTALEATLYQAVCGQASLDRVNFLITHNNVNDPAYSEALNNVRLQFEALDSSYFTSVAVSVRDNTANLVSQLVTLSQLLASEVLLNSLKATWLSHYIALGHTAEKAATLAQGAVSGASICGAAAITALALVINDLNTQRDALEQASADATIYWSIYSGLSDVRPTSSLAIELIKHLQYDYASNCFNIFNVSISWLSLGRNYTEWRDYYSSLHQNTIGQIEFHPSSVIEIAEPASGSLITDHLTVRGNARNSYDGVIAVSLINGTTIVTNLNWSPGVVSNDYTFEVPVNALNLGANNLQIQATSKAGVQTSVGLTVRSQTPLANGGVTPTGGTTSDTFTFNATYYSAFNTGPGPLGVRVNINGSEYLMTPSGSSWATGVPFSVSRTFSSGGIYNYYFIADLGSGQTTRLPSSGTWTLPVSVNAAGWDIGVDSLSLSASKIKPGQSVTVNGSAYNYSLPGNTYNNLGWQVQLIDPTGAIADTHTGTIATLTAPNGVNIPAQNFTLSSQGNYQILFTLLPNADSYSTNNSRSSVVLVSDQATTKQYYFTDADCWVEFTAVGQTKVNNGVTYIYKGMTTSRATFEINGTMRNVNNNSYRVDAGSVVFIEELANIGATCFASFGSEQPNYLIFDQVDIACYPGEQIAFAAHCTGASSGNAFSNTDPDFYGSSASQASSWYSSLSRSNSNKDIYYRFNVSSGASVGTYNFTIKSILSDGQFMRELQIRVVDRPPTLTGISTNIFVEGQLITVSGTSLGTTGTLYLADSVVSTVSWSSTAVQFIVPYGTTNGLLRVNNSAGSSGGLPYSVVQIPRLVLVPGSTNIAFGSVQYGNTSEWQSVTISNDGNAILSLSLLAWDAPTANFTAGIYNSSDVEIFSSSCEIAPHGYVVVKYKFHPSGLGVYSNSYLFGHNDTNYSTGILGVGIQGSCIDEVFPNLSISLPAPIGVYTSHVPSITIAGTAADNYRLSFISLSSDGGETRTNTSPSSLWAFTGLSLVDGMNMFTVSAQDSVGNTVASNIFVRYKPPMLFAGEGEPLVVSNGVFYAVLTGPIGSTNIVQKSIDLQNWIPFQTNTIPSGGFHLSVPTDTNPAVFFRVKEVL